MSKWSQLQLQPMERHLPSIVFLSSCAVASVVTLNWQLKTLLPKSEFLFSIAPNLAAVSLSLGLLGFTIGRLTRPRSTATVREQVEATPANGEEFLKLATSLSQIGCWTFNPVTGEARWNEGHFRLMGLDPNSAESHYETWRDRVHPDDRAQTEQFLSEALATQTALRVEYRFLLPDGAIRWVLSQGQALYDASGNAEQMTGVTLDISDRKQIEEALRHSESKYRALIEALPDLIMRMTSDGVYLDFFPTRTFKVFGGSNLVGQGIFDGGLPLDLAELRMQYIRQALETGESQSYEQQILIDGELHREDVRITVCGTNEVVVIVRNITDRKRMEEALWESRQLLQHILDSVPQAIFWKDRNSVYLGCNQNFARNAGITVVDDVIGKTDYDLPFTQEESDWYRQCDQLVMSSNTPELHIIETLQRVDGQQIWIETNKVPLHDASGRVVGVLGTYQDITTRKQAEEALQHKVAQERLLGEITDRIRQSLDLDRILNTAVAEVQRLLHADRVVIYRFRPDWSSEIVTEAVADGFQSIVGRIYHDSHFIETQGTTIQPGWMRSIADIHTADLPAAQAESLAQLQIRATLVLPILLHHAPLHEWDWEEDRVWGLLGVHSCVKPRQWQIQDIEFLKGLTSKLAIAIQQSALYQQLKQSNANLEYQVQKRTEKLMQSLNFEATLKRITDAVRDSLDETRILRTAVTELANTLNLDFCETALYDREQMTLTIQCDYSASSASVQGSVVEMSTYPELYAQTLTGVGCQFCPTTDAIALRPVARQSTIFSCPLADDQNVIGDIWLFKPCTEVFDELEVRLVQQVANQCAIALRQSHLYEAAQAQVRELERLNRLKDDFLSTVSHELRTPMSNIKMATQMLEILLEQCNTLETNANLTRYLQILRDEGEREMNLINDLLELSRLEAETEPLILTSIALQDWLPHVAESFVDRIRQQQQQLQLEIPADLPPLTTDLTYLERIYTELLSNACKYTPEGEIIRITATQMTVTQITAIQDAALNLNPLSSEVADADQPMCIQICVTNTGVEIPEGEREHIFEKFYRIPNNDPWKHSGTGLGLALVKKLVQKLGGTIAVSSGQNQTTFTLQFLLTLQRA